MKPDKLELEAIEAAVGGDRSDPVLSLIAEEARATAPHMSPAFAQRLDTAAAEGFVRPSAARRRVRIRLMPALGLAGATAVAVAVAVAVIPGGGSNPESLVAPPTAKDAAPQSGLAAPSTAVPAPAPNASAGTATAERSTAPVPGSRGRVQEHAAQLTLTTPASRLQDTADQVVAVVDRNGGYVASSNVAARDGAGEASFDLRVPASHLDETMAALSRLGHVRGRSEQVQDITSSYQSARSRLRDAEAERSGLLRALAGASTTQEIESIKARLRIARARIASASRELASVRHRANDSRVSVTLLGDGRPGPAPHRGGGSSWTPRNALHDALRVLSVAAGVVIVAAAAAVPLALLALLAALVARAARRRRREHALDGTAPAV